MTSSPLLITDPDQAVALLRAGGLVAIPTETVYGLAADARDPVAIERIFEAKGRPRDHPLIVHVASADRVEPWVDEFPEPAAVLATACWPGPLTLLLRRSSKVADAITAGRPTVGVRVPAHRLATAVLEHVDGLAAPSANRFGRISPTTAHHVIDDLGEVLVPGIDAVLDGGACPVGVESTIVDCTVDPPQVLRPGGIPTEDVHRLLAGRVAGASGPARTSGMLTAHYAPGRPLELIEHDADLDRHRQVLVDAGRTVATIDVNADLVVTARELYGRLRAADAEQVDVILARLPPPVGLGHAVRDRLHKAAAGSRP